MNPSSSGPVSHIEREATLDSRYADFRYRCGRAAQLLR
jgi:hypothetical protein